MKLLPILIEIGFTLSSDAETLVVVPASRLTDPLRDLIRENKVDLLMAVREAERGAAALVVAINRCCDLRGDDDRNRDALVAEAAALTPTEQSDMTEHFNEQGALYSAATGRGAL